MLGHRGCRLGITYPEITEMQARAIIEAAVAVEKEGIKTHAEVMIPLIATVKEMANQGAIVRRVAEEVFKEKGRHVHYLVGTMIELPRACLVADEIAKEAEFFSFGTNDLTQTTFGFSRDDVNKVLPTYLAEGILKQDPFAAIDRDGVGELVTDRDRTRTKDASQAGGGDLRRARRRAVVGGVLPSGGNGLRFVLPVPRADGAAGRGAGWRIGYAEG